MKPIISHKRHIGKTLTWRIVATGTTFVLALFAFNDGENALKKASYVAAFEAIVKMIFYYLHERVWYRIEFKYKLKSSIRHIAKTISWRVIASITTFAIIGYVLIFENTDPKAFEKATSVMLIENVLKMAFYYFHERLWYMTNFGIIDKKNNEK